MCPSILLMWRSRWKQMRARRQKRVSSQSSRVQVTFPHFLIYVFPVSILVMIWGPRWPRLRMSRAFIIQKTHKDPLFKSPNSTETGATYAQDSRSLGWCRISVVTKAEEPRHLLFHLHVCWHDLFSVRLIYDFFLMYNCRTWPWLQNSNWFIHTESPNCNLPQLTIHLTFKLLKNRQLYAN